MEIPVKLFWYYRRIFFSFNSALSPKLFFFYYSCFCPTQDIFFGFFQERKIEPNLVENRRKAKARSRKQLVVLGTGEDEN